MPSSTEQAIFFDLGFDRSLHEVTQESWNKLLERVNKAGQRHIVKDPSDHLQTVKVLHAIIDEQSEAIELLKLLVSHTRMFLGRLEHPEWYSQQPPLPWKAAA